MGAGASSMGGPDGEGGYRPGLGDLPEACVASVLLHLDPPEICRVARLNRAFRGAASADFVWESKLPGNYGYLLEKLAQEEDGGGHRRRRRAKRLGKKEIYASLCHPNPFDGGTKMFWLEKYKGGLCMSISSKALSITGIDDRRYWNYIPTDESRSVASVQGKAALSTKREGSTIVVDRETVRIGSVAGHHPATGATLPPPGLLHPHGTNRTADCQLCLIFLFHTVAYLQQIWWFEVDGEIEFYFPAGVYSLFFRLQLGRISKRLGRRICNPEHVHGWDVKPVWFQLSTSSGYQTRTKCFLDGPGNWIHYPVGEFMVENSNVLTKIKFSMTQIDCTHTKGGLCVDSVLIYPSGVRPEKVFVHDR